MRSVEEIDFDPVGAGRERQPLRSHLVRDVENSIEVKCERSIRRRKIQANETSIEIRQRN